MRRLRAPPIVVDQELRPSRRIDDSARAEGRQSAARIAAEGWLYLAVVLDLKSRFVVGWQTSNSLEASLATDALSRALWSRRPASGLLHHSDRGVQYACAEYQEMLHQNGMCASMSRKGNCWDNAVAESFFATLEKELVEGADWQTHEQARRDLFSFLEIWYNRQRRHSSLGYRTPAEIELALTPRAA